MAGGATVGQITYDARINTKMLASDAATADAAVKGFADKSVKHTGVATKGFQTLSKVGIYGVGAAAVAAGALIIKNIGGAVRRVDTLNNFPKVMANLGYGADEARAAINKLEKGVRGLPTSLDGIASAMQNISPSTKTLDQATNIALALNNALLAGGKSADIQATAMEQFSQAISKGKPDMMEWRTLATAMPGQLDQISQSLGFGRGGWQKMATAVSEGDLKFSKVTDAIVKLNEKGLKKFPSFAEQAKNATGGIGTAMANANTAITRGIANMIQAIGTAGLSNAIVAVGNAFEKGFKVATKAFIDFSKFLKENKWAVDLLVISVITLAAAIGVALVGSLGTFIAAVGSAVVVVAPFIAAAYLIYRNWAKVKQILGTVFSTFRPVLNLIGSVITGIFLPALQDLWKVVSKQLKPVFNSLGDVFKQFWALIKGIMPVLKIIGIVIGVIIVGAVLLLVQALKLVFPVINFVLQVIANAIAVIAAVFRGVIGAVTGVINWLRTNWPLVIAILTGPIGIIVLAIVKNWDTIKGIFTGFLNWLKTNWPLVLAILTGPIGLAVLAITKNWDKIKNGFKTAFDFIKRNWPLILAILTGPIGLAVLAIAKNWDKIVNFFKAIPGRLKAFAGNIKDAVLSPFKQAFNLIAKLWNNTVAKISFKAPSWVPKIGGKGWSIPKIPEFAKGVNNFAGGAAVVGERGPEIVNLPRGSQVIPNHELSSVNSGTNVVVNLDMNGIMASSRADLRIIAKDMINAVNEELRAKGITAIGNGAI